MTTITRQELESTLTNHNGNAHFRQAFETVSAGDDLVKLLASYVHFNSTFGAGVANLAGEIGVRQETFIDPSDPVKSLADRSMEIAGDIFFAAVDEFDDRSTPHKDTHRTLAAATIKATAAFYGIEDAKLDTLATPNSATKQALRDVQAGYGLARQLDDADMFRAIGFHLGSEVLADEEFNILDATLRRRFEALVDHLRQTSVELNRAQHNAYWWVHIHTSVEADHFDHAVTGVNDALRFYRGSSTADDMKRCVIEGFKRFAEVQGKFMEELAAIAENREMSGNR